MRASTGKAMARRGHRDVIRKLGMENQGQSSAPCITDLPPDPQSRIQLIRCNCSADCSTLRCSCRNNNMQCSSACGQCKGSSCTNSAITPLPPDYDSEDSEECRKCISLYGKRRGAEKVGLTRAQSREYYHYEMLKKRRLFKSKCECLKCTLHVGLCSGHGSFL